MFTFDYNGNILTQQRYEGSTLVDNLTYQYATNSAGDLLSNRLYSVDDAVTNASLSATDMEDMPLYNNASPNASNNYKYTQIGELKSDNQEEIQEIVWRVDSKISEIVRTSGSTKKNLKFEYDAMGNRVAKHVYAGSVLESSTYYVRDAQGNVMGVYEHKMDAENAVMEYKLIERNIYGSAQVGICKDTVDLNITNASGALTQAMYYHARQLNHRQYSLSNHLGNVLTTIGDGKAPVDSNSDGVIDYYVAYIISVSDYSPFGVELASRTWSIEEYRNGFNGKESDDEVKGQKNNYDFGARMQDPRIGRWLSVDKHASSYPDISPYTFAANNPIIYVDFDGNDIVYFDSKGNEVKRDLSDTQFGARVDLKGDGNYSVAPMPNIITGYEAPTYQQHDYIIAAETHIFNNLSPSERPKSANGLTLDGAQPIQLSPTLVKAIILEETLLGNYNGSAGQQGKSDIMQANVTTTSGRTDWNESKANYGLEKGKSATPQQSVHAGIRILFSKGLIVSEEKYKKNGELSEDSKVSWRGGNLESWWAAVKNYNGNNTKEDNGKLHKENYVKNVFKNWNNSLYSQDAKYYVEYEK